MTPNSPTETRSLTLESGLLRTLEHLTRFNPEGFVKQSVFYTPHLQLGIYCFNPGQINSLHRHPHSSELLFFEDGVGEVLVDAKFSVVSPGTFIHIPPDTWHEIRNTGSTPMIVILIQSPLPCLTERAAQ